MQEERARNRHDGYCSYPSLQKLLAVGTQLVRDAWMRGFSIGLSISLAFIVGCVASSTRYGVPKAEAAAVVEQRWSYFCFEAEQRRRHQLQGQRGGHARLGNGGGHAQRCQRPDGLVLPPTTSVNRRRREGASAQSPARTGARQP